MTPCTELSNRMPDVAHGRSRWTEPEEHHLATCADCRAEWILVTAAMRLGASLAPPDDLAHVTTLLLERLARERELTRRLRLWSVAGLAAAAAVIIVVWSGAGGGAPSWGGEPARVATAPDTSSRTAPRVTPADTGVAGRGAPAPTGASDRPDAPALATVPADGRGPELPLPEIDDLPAEALDSMLQVLDEPALRADAYELPALGDSGDRELEQALTGLEG